MPKKINVRETKNPLGQKINMVMAEKGMEGDYAALAKIFDVRPPSVYDWITHGRLGKERYLTLVEWSGRSLDWWFDVARAAPVEAGVEIREELAAYRVKKASDWPFSSITPAMYAKLSEFDRGQVQGFIHGLLLAAASD